MSAILEYIYIPFSYVMKGCLWITQNNYFFALFFFALVFQILLFPLAIKQQKSQISMAKVRPKEQAIRKKYAGRTDKVTQQKMQQEIQGMYQAEGYNPLSGCLPLLIQLPLILILYSIVRCPVEYSSNFTDAAKNNIHAAITTEASDDIGKPDKLENELNKLVVFYVEDIRANLCGENKAAIDEVLVDKQKDLRALAVSDGKDEAGNEKNKKYENGLVMYEFSENAKSGYPEMYCADVLANYADDYIQSLKESGDLKADYTNKYNLYVEENGEKQYYAEMLPDFSFLGINLLHEPSITSNKTWRDWILLLIPILVFVTSFLNTKITKHFNPTPANPNGQTPGSGILMNVGLPLMSACFTLMFPAAIGVYWVWRTLISMVQPVILNKMYPMPTFTEEDFAEAERELKGKTKKKKVITIEVDEDDDSYADIEVPSSRVETARPKGESMNQKSEKEDLPYRRPSKIEMLSADDDEPQDESDKSDK